MYSNKKIYLWHYDNYKHLYTYIYIYLVTELHDTWNKNWQEKGEIWQPKNNSLRLEYHLFILFFSTFSILVIYLFYYFFYFTILYWFCHISTWICHRCTCVPHPEPPPISFPIPSLWVVSVHQPQASSIMHRTWTGDSFHIWYYTCFNAILPIIPPSPSPTESKRLFYTSVSILLSSIQGYHYREGDSGWVTHVYLWRIHVDIWQNQYNIVK